MVHHNCRLQIAAVGIAVVADIADVADDDITDVVVLDYDDPDV